MPESLSHTTEGNQRKQGTARFVTEWLGISGAVMYVQYFNVLVRNHDLSLFNLAGPWLEQKIPQGFMFYYNTATQQSSWAKPADFANNSGLLTKEEIQVK